MRAKRCSPGRRHPNMARLVLALALCCGAANGLGVTKRLECEQVGYPVWSGVGEEFTADCDEIGETCEVGGISGVCVQYYPLVSTSA